MIILGVFLIVAPIIAVIAIMALVDGWRAVAFSLACTAAICVPIFAGAYMLSLAGVIQ